jgi:prolyl oligopeptidase
MSENTGTVSGTLARWIRGAHASNVWRFAFVLILSSLSLLAAAALYAGNDSNLHRSVRLLPWPKSSRSRTSFHGTRVVDNYRWLEDGNAPETQKWVAEEMAYTRGMLDHLAGRDAIHKRLTELLSIGSVTPPILAGRHYFYTRREGMQNQPILYVRDGLDGADRVLVDANQLAADGTIALDWFQPSENGKYVAYGTSSSGSEMSTLHIIETKTGTAFPTPSSALAPLPSPGSSTTPASITPAIRKKATSPTARKCTTATSSITRSATIPARTTNPSSAKAATPKTGPACISPTTAAGCSSTSPKAGPSPNFSDGPEERHAAHAPSPPAKISSTAPKSTTTSSTSPPTKTPHVTASSSPTPATTIAKPGRNSSRNPTLFCKAPPSSAENFSLQYEQNATSQLKLFDLDGKKLTDIALPAIGSVFGSGGRWDRDEAFFGFQSFTTPPSIYRIELTPVHVEYEAHWT